MPFSFLWVLVAAAFIHLSSGSITAQEPIKKPDVLTAVVLKEFPPNYIIDDNNQPAGFAIDALNRIAANAGFQTRYVIKNNWGEIVEALHTGQADLCPLIGTTPERLEKLDFTSTILVEQVVLIVRRSTEDIHQVSDLNRRRIGVISRSVAWEILRPNFESSLVEIDRTGDAIVQLLAGRVDVLAVPKGVFLDMAYKAGVADRIKLVGPPLSELYRAMAVRKGNEELLRRLEPEVQRFVSSADYRQAYNRWYGPPQPFWTAQKIVLTMSGILLVSLLAMGLWRHLTMVQVNRRLKAEITERRKAEEKSKQLELKLLQAQKLESIGTLAGGIAHDFNNILYPLIGFTELLKEDLPVESPLQSHVSEILLAGSRLKDLVKQILVFSRKGDQNAAPILLQPIVKEALRLLRASIPTTIDIQDSLSDDCGFVMADPTQIHQVVMNLATNAYHAMENTGGSLRVSLKQVELTDESDALIQQGLEPGTFAVLTVADTGTGIEKDIIDKIFDPYFTTKGVGKGTGLGLSVVRGVVKAHKGDIQIVSQPGSGTEVHVFLPILRKPVEHMNAEIKKPIPMGSEKILLVDDSEPVVQVEQQLLQKLGYQVEVFLSSSDALAAFKADSGGYDLVLTDMTMPHMTGIQLAEQINSIRPDVPVILCTGFSDKIHPEKATETGISGILMKPVNRSDMAMMVRKVLNAVKGRKSAGDSP